MELSWNIEVLVPAGWLAAPEHTNWTCQTLRHRASRPWWGPPSSPAGRGRGCCCGRTGRTGHSPRDSPLCRPPPRRAWRCRGPAGGCWAGCSSSLCGEGRPAGTCSLHWRLSSPPRDTGRRRRSTGSPRSLSSPSSAYHSTSLTALELPPDSEAFSKYSSGAEIFSATFSLVIFSMFQSSDGMLMFINRKWYWLALILSWYQRFCRRRVFHSVSLHLKDI